MRTWLPLLLIWSAGAALAQDAPEPLPDFQTCMNEVVADYEQKLVLNRNVPLDDVVGGLWSVGEVYYCGSVGIVNCDRSDGPLACQQAFEGRQDRLTEAVLDGLAEPDAVAGEGWAKELYDQAFVLAHGSSAGPDCDGSPEVMEAWCRAREANTRLQNAILAWQVGRYLGAAPDAIEAGWADVPPPIRPRPRP